MHENHRERVKKRFLSEGLDAFEPHNILEFLLFYSIPQKDTNEIAHALIERFGSLENVFDAPMEALTQVPGVKEHTATLLKMIPAYARRYCEDKNFMGERFFSIQKIGQYLLNYYRNMEKEITVLLLLDNKFNLIETVKVYEGPFHSPYIGMKEILETVLQKRTSVVVLSHNHPGGVPLPTSGDVIKTQELDEAFRWVDIKMIAHILVAGDSYVDLLQPQASLSLGQE